MLNAIGHPLMVLAGIGLLSGCHLAAQDAVSQRPQDPTVLVGPFTMEVEISHSDKIYSFTEPPSSDYEPSIRKQLVEEVRLKAQRLLGESLAKQPRFSVIPFQDARLAESEVGTIEGEITTEFQRALGRAAGAEIVVFGRVLGYGQLPLRYWLAGWAVTASSQQIVVGVISGGNPIAMLSYLGFDIMTDLPLWTGGFYSFGWAFRPVLIEVEAWQLVGCEQQIWLDREFALVSHKALETYPESEREKKQVQLESNLHRVVEMLAEKAKDDLELRPCPTPEMARISTEHALIASRLFQA